MKTGRLLFVPLALAFAASCHSLGGLRQVADPAPAADPPPPLNVCFQALTNLDASTGTNLTDLYCGYGELADLDVPASTNLARLYGAWNRLEHLDLSGNPDLAGLYGDHNDLTELDLSNNPCLKILDCGNNRLTSLDLSRQAELTELQCDANRLTELDVSRCTDLSLLVCDGNQITNLDLTSNASLTWLSCSSNGLTNLDISANTNLFYVNARLNPLSRITVWWRGPARQPRGMLLQYDGEPVIEIHPSLLTGSWSEAEDAGSGWKRFNWFGCYREKGDGWFWHTEHGWLQRMGATTKDIRFYSSRLGWLWTTDRIYPFLWSDGLQTWLWYYRDTGNGSGGWFHNYDACRTEWR